MIIEGQGIHSGENCIVELIKKDSGGLSFSIIENGIKKENFFKPGNLDGFSLNSENATTIMKDSSKIETIEHILAALVLFSHAHLEIVINSAELPILDGSSIPWFSGFVTLLGSASMPEFSDKKYPSFSWKNENSSMTVEPAKSLIIDYSLNLNGRLERILFDAKSMGDWFKLLSARTFIRNDYFDLVKSKGLLKGATDGTGILYQTKENSIDNFSIEIISGAPLRDEKEFVWHKILDLIGDLALLGLQLPKAHFKIKNGGHWLNHQYIKKCIS